MQEFENPQEQKRRSVWKTVLLVLAAVILVCVGIYLVFSLSDPLTVTLTSQETVLEYGEDYVGPGVTVSLNGERVNAVIEVDQPKMDRLGTYTVTFTATYGNYTATAEQKVTVVDTQAPVITLTYADDAFTEPGKDYEEEGYSAWDNVDGDLTERVKRAEENGTVVYTVTDSSGNSTRVERTIVYDDRTAPELVLLGDETVTITAGSKFEEPGYTATDNVDGDITVNVSVDGTVNIDVPGSYTIRYTVTDSHGNTTEADRDVIVENTKPPETEPTEKPTEEPTEKPTEAPPKKDEDDQQDDEEVLINIPENAEKKVIYLTFDDGPGAYTMELLEILEKYNVKVTFFVVGTAKLEYLDEIAEAGHAIGLHSNTHNYSKIYKSEEAFFKDLYALQKKVYDRCGVKSFLYRFPGGSSNSISRKYCKGIMTKLVKEVENEGFTYFDWNVDSCDAGGATTAEEVYKKVISGVKKREIAVVLQHDIKEYSVNAVEKIIRWGLKNGYTFLPLTEEGPVVHHGLNN